MGALLHWTQANSFELMGGPNHGHLPLPGSCNWEPKFSRKSWPRPFKLPCSKLYLWANDASHFDGDNEHPQRETKWAFGTKPEFWNQQLSRKLEIKSAGNLKSAAQFWWIDLFLPMKVFQPVWHSHNIRDTETGSLFWCLAVESLLVHSYPLLCLQGQDRLAKLAFLVLNVINLALFQAGWSKKFIWPFSHHFLALFGFLLKLLSGNPGISCQTSERFVLLLVFIM